MRPTTVRCATSTIETSLEGPLAVYNVRPSADIPMPHGLGPTSISATGRIRLRIDRHHLLAASGRHVDEAAVRRGHDPHRPRVLEGERDRLQGACFFASTTATACPFSHVT
jgi:hypothetical protein